MRSLGGAPVVELVPGSGETQGAPLPPPPVSVSARQEGGHRSGGGVGVWGPSPDRRGALMVRGPPPHPDLRAISCIC